MSDWLDTALALLDAACVIWMLAALVIGPRETKPNDG